jgi:MoaA/NifB/PqqE/SkfB family radical SAM enzyme
MCKQWRQGKREELNTKEWKDVICQLRELGIEEINFTGGEPLLREDIFDLAKYAFSLGVRCGITTNGFLLDKDKVNSLIENGLAIFTLSIDALGDAYDAIRGLNGAYRRVENAAKILSDFRRKKGISAHISFVLMRPTLEHLESVLSLCKELDFPVVICLLDKTPYLFDLEEMQNNLWIKESDYPELKKVQSILFKEKKSNNGFIYNSFSDIEFFESYFKDPVQKQIPCVVSQTRIFIDSSGNVFGGCWSMGSFGNIKERRLVEIVNSRHYKEMHKKMFFKNCPGCSCGYATNLRYSLNSQIKNIWFNFFSRAK